MSRGGTLTVGLSLDASEFQRRLADAIPKLAALASALWYPKPDAIGDRIADAITDRHYRATFAAIWDVDR